MLIQIVRNDIAAMHVDAIVNAAKPSLLGGGGADGSIHRAAGPELLEECRALGGCRPGDAKITKGYDLPCRYVIHTVGPVWHGGMFLEKRTLTSCYRKSLMLAHAHGCGSIAFPLISAGTHGYPKDKALRVALDTIGEFLADHDMTVYIVVYDRESFALSGRLFADVAQYIDDHYVAAHEPDRIMQRRRFEAEIFGDASADGGEYDLCTSRPFVMPDAAPQPNDADGFADSGSYDADAYTAPAPDVERRSAPERAARPRPCIASAAARRSTDEFAPAHAGSLQEALLQIDESFTQMVLRKIDERGVKDSVCYKKANMDRKHFSKLRSDIQYKPKKTTAVALAIALELPLEEARDLLMKAGYALSHSNKFDIIIEYCLKNGVYDIHTVNQILFEFDQMTL